MPIGSTELIIVLVIVLVLFGGKKIPELLRGVGRGVGELHKGLDEAKKGLHQSANDDDDRDHRKSIEAENRERTVTNVQP